MTHVNGFSHDLYDDHFATKAVHAGQSPSQWVHRAVIPPISLATTFQQLAPAEPVQFDYSRSGNPTRSCLETSIAALECAKYGLCFSSGLATTLTLTHLLKTGDHVICGDDVYGGTNRFFRTVANKMGVVTSVVDATSVTAIKNAFQPNTRMVWIETPTNPTMKLSDIRGVADIVQTMENVILVVDNTFMSPYFQKPLLMGADIALHSVSKYINGHSDVIMGAIATSNDEIYEKLKYLQNSLGTVPSPFDCFLVNRGIKTLHVRMEQHMTNGLAVAKFLESHPMVRKVLHPGLPSHPQHDLAVKQCTGFSGMVSFYLKGGAAEAKAFVQSLKVFILAESLGSVESLVEIPVLMTHASVPQDQRDLIGIDDSLIRLSAGIEATQDLLDDLNEALKACAINTK